MVALAPSDSSYNNTHCNGSILFSILVLSKFIQAEKFCMSWQARQDIFETVVSSSEHMMGTGFDSEGPRA
jgi:hypothetical protein